MKIVADLKMTPPKKRNFKNDYVFVFLFVFTKIPAKRRHVYEKKQLYWLKLPNVKFTDFFFINFFLNMQHICF